MVMKQRKQMLSDASPLLEVDIRKGLFTPFLGAGVSGLGSSEINLESYPWKEVAATLTAISSHLDNKGDLSFLRSFTKQRLRLSDGEEKEIVPITESPRATDAGLDESVLVKLQAELAQATARMTRYFGARFSEESPSIQNLEGCSVEFDLNSEEDIGVLARDCLGRLFAAADLAFELMNKACNQSESPFLVQVAGTFRGLERRRLYQKLLTLIVGLIGNNRERYHKNLERHRLGGRLMIPYDVENGTTVSFGALRLDAIQWMSDFLWYTVRYWIPFFPTTDELAFELSLVVKDGPPRRAALAQIAQVLENRDNSDTLNKAGSKSLAQIVSDLVIYCETVQERKEGPDWQTKAFYYSIVAALQYQFEKYREIVANVAQHNFKDKFRRSARDDEESLRSKPFPVPIVFTTSFDCALEKVLEENDLCFHIVFPVLRRNSLYDEKTSIPIWMIRTHYPKSAKLSPRERLWEEICNHVNGIPSKPFDGPIIVKLHGSPSLDLHDTNAQHWTVLSETGYLDSLGSGTNVPVWLEAQISSKGSGAEVEGVLRSLWFLGYSISDWNVRLRLFEHCNEHRKLGGRRNAVNRPGDVYHTAILGNLEVEQYEGDLTDLPRLILDIFEENDLKASERVTRLIEGIRKNLLRYPRWKAM
jgi:hypothetical protein